MASDVVKTEEYTDVGIEVVEEPVALLFGEFLVERQALSRQQLFMALMEQDKNRETPLGQVICNMGMMAPSHLEDLLAEFHSIAAIELDPEEAN